jgi:hypothetical protein
LAEQLKLTKLAITLAGTLHFIAGETTTTTKRVLEEEGVVCARTPLGPGFLATTPAKAVARSKKTMVVLDLLNVMMQ